MKILILGAEGNLGTQLVKVFDSGENEVIPWDRGEIDITDRELILKKMDDIKPNIVINAAAYNSVDKCEASDEEYEIAKKINIDGPKNIAEAALRNGVIFVHFSTDYVFDGKKKKGYIETDTPAPINRYGKTKFHGEKRVLELSGSGLRWYMIRTSKLFGPKGDSASAKPSFFDNIEKLSHQGKDELEIVDDELSCFTYAPDLARATKELLDSGKGFGIYHFVNEGPATWYQVAQEYFRLMNRKIILKPIKGIKLPRSAQRPRYSVLLNTKFGKLRPWNEALKEYIDLGSRNEDLR